MGRKGYLAPTFNLLIKRYLGLLQPLVRQIALPVSPPTLLFEEVISVYQEHFFLPKTVQRLEDQLTLAATMCHWTHCCDRYRFRIIPHTDATKVAMAKGLQKFTVNPRNWDLWQRLTRRGFKYTIQIWGERDYGAICPTGHPCPPQQVRCETECVICWNDGVIVVYSPCGHGSVCIGCQTRHAVKQCPLCREEIIACWRAPKDVCKTPEVPRWELQPLIS